jgi:hypothetical protein
MKKTMIAILLIAISSTPTFAFKMAKPQIPSLGGKVTAQGAIPSPVRKMTDATNNWFTGGPVRTTETSEAAISEGNCLVYFNYNTASGGQVNQSVNVRNLTVNCNQ